MTGQRTRIVLTTLGVVVLALVAIVAFRLPLAEAGLTALLRSVGFAEPRVSVIALGWQAVELADIAVGGEQPLTVEHARATYDAGSLLRGRLRAVAVDGARIGIAIADGEAGIDGLPIPQASSTDDGAAALVLPLDSIALRNLLIAARTPIGAVEARLDGQVETDGDTPGLRVDLTYALSSPYGEGNGSLSARASALDSVEASVAIDSGAVRAPFAAASGLAGRADLTLRDGALTLARLDLSAPELAADGGLAGAVAIVASYGGERGTASVTLREAEDAAHLALELSVDQILSAPAWDLSGRMELGAGSALWGALDLRPPSAGRAMLSIASQGVPAPAWATARPTTLGDALAHLTGLTDATLTLAGFEHADIGSGIEASIAISLVADQGIATLRLSESASLTMAGLSPALFDPQSLPADWRPRRIAPLSLRLHDSADGPARLVARPDGDNLQLEADFAASATAGGKTSADAALTAGMLLDATGALQSFDLSRLVASVTSSALPAAAGANVLVSGSLRGTPEQVAGDIDLAIEAQQVSLPEAGMKALTASLPLSFEATRMATTVHLRQPGRLTVEELAAGATVRLPGAVDLALNAGAAPLLTADTAATPPRLAHAIRLGGKAVALDLLQPAGEPLRLQLHQPELSLSATLPGAEAVTGDATLTLAALTMPAHAIRAEGLEGQATLRDAVNRIQAKLTTRQIRHEGSPPWFAPLSAEATANLENGNLTFISVLRDAGAVDRVAASGHFTLASGKGDASISLPPLRFAPDALQPGALLPALSELQQVSGELTAELELAISPDGMDGTGVLRMDAIGFQLGNITVRGLTTQIDLASLSPLATATGQRLSIAGIDSVTPITDIALRYRLQPAGNGDTLPHLLIERADAKVFGGAVSAADLRLGAGQATTRLPIAVDGLQLEALLALIDAEGVSGSGSLSGVIPLVIADGSIAVDKGQLAALGDGVIRIRSEQVANAIGQGSEDVALVARALEDFRYEKLSLQIDKAAHGDGQVALKMLGHNPAVLDGHPFQFNINLTSNVDDLLEALTVAYGSATGVMNRALDNLR